MVVLKVLFSSDLSGFWSDLLRVLMIQLLFIFSVAFLSDILVFLENAWNKENNNFHFIIFVSISILTCNIFFRKSFFYSLVEMGFYQWKKNWVFVKSHWKIRSLKLSVFWSCQVTKMDRGVQDIPDPLGKRYDKINYFVIDK